MTEPEHDPEIARRYRELEREAPSRALDEAIVTAARRELESRPAPLVAPTARRRWYVPLAAAAVIVLSVVVTLQLQREQPDLEVALPQVLPPSATPAPTAPVASPPSSAASEVVAERAPRAKQPAPAATAGSVEAKPFAQRPPPAPAAQAPAATPHSERDIAPRARAEDVAPPALEPASPEAWLRRIAEMRREGRHAEADESYAAFRRRYPEYRIPEALRDQVLPR